MCHPDPNSAVRVPRRTFLAGTGLGVLGLAMGVRPTWADEDRASNLSDRVKVPGTFCLHARSRKETVPGQVEIVTRDLSWKAAETAIVVCDMWDKHWCAGATRRVGVLVPRMNPVLDAARSLGVMIIHAPSETMDFYKDTSARKRMQQAPKVDPPAPIGGCPLDPGREGTFPIDDSDGGCDCSPPCKTYKAWSRQHPGLDIAQEDGVSDSGAEIYNFVRQQGITNVVIMGVHTNMCILGRSFGIRQLTKLGLNVVLARDLTDTMYNPRMKPYVSHARGTELVIEHIERHWCPSIGSVDLTSALEQGPF